MSLILEALRKSEAERRRGNTPDVAMELPPVTQHARSATPAWLWPTLLAACALAASAWWLAGRGDAVDAVETPAVEASTAVTETAPAASAPAVVPRIPATPAASAAAPAPVVVAESTAPTPAPQPAAARPQPQSEPVREAPPAQPVAIAAPAPPPTASSMSGVKLSMHMWDAAQERRFVILNGQRMGEGDRNGDVQVVAIERDGVVVERDGQRARIALP